MPKGKRGGGEGGGGKGGGGDGGGGEGGGGEGGGGEGGGEGGGGKGGGEGGGGMGGGGEGNLIIQLNPAVEANRLPIAGTGASWNARHMLVGRMRTESDAVGTSRDMRRICSAPPHPTA